MESYYVELTEIGRSHLNKEEIDTSDLKEDEALIKCEYSMISAGTELSRAYALKKGFSYPVRPGYCMVGRIVEKGKNIDAEVGDLVFCNAPHSSFVRWKNTDTLQGSHIIRLNEKIDPVEATAMNLLLVAIQGVNLTKTRLGDVVAVYGLGNIGILTALMYQKMGCKVIGIDPMEYRRNIALKMGLKYTAGNDSEELIASLTKGKGADICVDATGLSNVIIDCVSHTKQYGQVVLLGSPRQSYEADITPVFSMIHMKNLKVLGAFNQTTSVLPKEGSDDSLLRNFEVCQDLIINKDIDVSKMITKIIDPEDCEKAYEELMYHKDEVNCIVYDWRKYQ